MKAGALKTRGSQMQRSYMRRVSVATGAKVAATLWKWFALFIKIRDNWTCFTCGKYSRGRDMNAGHFIEDAVGGNALRYNEVNVHAQCETCNCFKDANKEVYERKMLETYGHEIVDALKALQNKSTFDYDFKERTAHYKNAVTQMQSTEIFLPVQEWL